MTTVLKSKSKARVASLASALSTTFAEYASVDDRTIRILCSPDSFADHGMDWYRKAKESAVEVAKRSGFTIASWDETEFDGRYALVVSMTTELASSNDNFAGEIFLRLGRELKGVIDVKKVHVVHGDNLKGTMQVFYDSKDFPSELERVDAVTELRARLKIILKQSYNIKSCTFGTIRTGNDTGGLSVIYK